MDMPCYFLNLYFNLKTKKIMIDNYKSGIQPTFMKITSIIQEYQKNKDSIKCKSRKQYIFGILFLKDSI